MGLADLLKISQDAAVELEDIRQPGFAHQNSGFFAADAPCAKAHDGLALQLVGVGVEVGFEGGRKLGELDRKRHV